MSIGLKQKLGHWKWLLLGGGWKEQKHRKYIERLDRDAGTQESLSRVPITLTSDTGPVEIHTLCGKKNVTQGIYGLYSLLRFAPEKFALYIHSDGTLAAEDWARWHRFFPRAHPVEPLDARKRFQLDLPEPEFATLHRVRSWHVMQHKLLDVHLYGESRKLLLMDTDVLFFQRPDELLDACFDERDRGFACFRDIRSTYVAQPDILLNRYGGVVERFNAGVTLMNRFNISTYREVQQIFDAADPAWRPFYLWEQTVYALLAARHGCRFLGEGYHVSEGLGTPIAVHYAGPARVRMYTEGIPRLLAKPAL